MAGKSILNGENTSVKPKLIHRIFEETLNMLKLHDEDALIQEGKSQSLYNNFFF